MRIVYQYLPIILDIYKKEYKIYLFHRVEGNAINKKEVIKILKKAGWIETDLGNGSHIVFIHPETKGRTVVPNNKGKDIPKGTLAAIRRQTGIDEIH